MSGLPRGSAALVTGAGSGIGRAIALRLGREGYRIAVNDLDPEMADAVVAEIEAAGGQAMAAPADVSDREAVRAMVDDVADAFAPVGLLVNNAGHGYQATLVDTDPAEFDRIFAVHVRGTFNTMQAVLPAMIDGRQGVIVNIASQLGQIGGSELAAYSGAKGAIIAMTKSLAREVSREGVRVNAIAPGPINTPLVEALSSDWKTEKAAGLPLRRFGEPDEVAGSVVFLASADGALFVGQTLGPNSGDVML